MNTNYSKPIISVIVPVYKVEKYLAKCVNSILKQTYEALEIILVDDGSPDKCPAICDEFAAQDKRVKVIHKQNGGVSSARNCGIMEAKGTYVQFVDSDDYIESTLCEELINCMGNKTDWVISGFTIIDDNNIKTKYSTSMIEKQYSNTDINYFMSLVYNKFFDMPVNKLYKKDLIKTYFDCKLPIGEDRKFNIEYFKNLKNSISLCDTCGYIYVFNNNSACHKQRDDLYELTIESLNYLSDFLKNHFGSNNNANFHSIIGNTVTSLIFKTPPSQSKILYCNLQNLNLLNDYISNYKPNGFKEKLRFFLLKHKMYKLLKFLSKVKNKNF